MIREEKEEFYRTLFEKNPYGIQGIDTSGTILYANKAHHDMYGYKEGDLIGRSITDFLVPGPQRDELPGYLAMLVKDQPPPVNYYQKVVTKQGLQKDIEVTWNYLRDTKGDVKGFISVLTDVTKSRRIEEEIYKINEKFTGLYNHSSDAIGWSDENGTLKDVNNAFCKLTGYSKEELLSGKKFQDLTPEKYHGFEAKIIREMIIKREGKPLPYEKEYIKKDGSRVFILVTAFVVQEMDKKPIGFVAIIKDITERKHMENVLRNSARRFEILHKISNDALTIRPIEEIIQVVLGYIREAVPCARVSIVMVDSKKNQAIVIAVDSETKTRMGKDVRFPLKEFGIEESLYLGENTAVDDIGTLSNPSAVDKLLMAEGIRSYIKIPLMDLDELISIINIGCDKLCPFTSQDLEISREIADLLSLIMRSKRQDRELRMYSERLDLATKSAGAGIWDWDIVTNEVYQSPRFKELLGYEDHEVEASFDFWEKNLHPDERDLVIKALNDNLERHIPFDKEYRLKTKSGEYHWFKSVGKTIRDDQNKPIRMSGAIIDINERKQVEIKLFESEKKYRALFEQAADSIVLVDVGTGALVEFNDMACENLGYTREEFKKLKISDFEVVESKEDVAKHLQKIIKEGADLFETKHRKKNGEIQDILVSTRAILTGEKKFVQSIWKDFTSHKQAEEALKKSHHELEVRVKERTSEFEKANEELLSEINERKSIESKLREADKELKFHAVELEEINTALKVLLKQLEGDKSDFEGYVTTNIKRLIMPYVAKLKKRKSMSKELAFLNVIETNLNEIISPFANKLSSKYLGFTPKEIQIANLIKDGRHDKEISETLESSLETIKTHRQNMRKKLGIQGKKINMRSYLMSINRQ